MGLTIELMKNRPEKAQKASTKSAAAASIKIIHATILSAFSSEVIQRYAPSLLPDESKITVVDASTFSPEAVFIFAAAVSPVLIAFS